MFKHLAFLILVVLLACASIRAQQPSQAGTLASQKIAAAGGGITFDAVASSAAGASASRTVSITVGTLTNGYMIVGVMIFGNSVSAMTFDTTQIPTKIDANPAQEPNIELWGLKAPHSGTHDLIVTFTGSNDNAVGVMTFDGVNQTTSVGTAAWNNGTDAAPTVDVTSATGEMVVGIVSNNFNTTMTAGTGVTDKWNQGASGSFATAAGGYKSGAATTTFVWALGVSKTWTIGGVSLKPV